MMTYYIMGETFDLKDEIKNLKPIKKDFYAWWKFNYEIQCWELEFANKFINKKFYILVKEFCKKHDLLLHIPTLSSTEVGLKEKKFLNDFENSEAFYDYLHRIKLKK